MGRRTRTYEQQERQIGIADPAGHSCPLRPSLPLNSCPSFISTILTFVSIMHSYLHFAPTPSCPSSIRFVLPVARSVISLVVQYDPIPLSCRSSPSSSRVHHPFAPFCLSLVRSLYICSPLCPSSNGYDGMRERWAGGNERMMDSRGRRGDEATVKIA